MMGQRDLARHRGRPAAAQRHRARGVVRGAEDARGPALRSELAHQAQDCGRLERLIGRHRRQDAGKALRQHRLAGAGRPDQQHAVSAGGRNLERTLGGKLSLDVEKIGINRRRQPHHRLMFGDRSVPTCRRRRRAGARPPAAACAPEKSGCRRPARLRRRSRRARRSRGAARRCAATSPRHKPSRVFRAPAAVRRSATVRRRTHTDRACGSGPGRSPPIFRVRSEGRSGRIPSAGRPEPGSL